MRMHRHCGCWIWIESGDMKAQRRAQALRCLFCVDSDYQASVRVTVPVEGVVKVLFAPLCQTTLVQLPS